MFKHFSVAMIGVFLVTVPVSYGSAQSTLHAQTKKTVKDGPAVARAKKEFGQRVAAATKNISLAEYLTLNDELHDELEILRKQSEFYAPDRTYPTEKRRLYAAKRYADINAARDVLSEYFSSAASVYEPTLLSKHIYVLRQKCENKEADRLLERLRVLVAQFKLRSDAATLAGSKSKIAVGGAYDDYISARSEYRTAKGFARKKCKEKKKIGDIDNGGETIIGSDVSGPATELVREKPWEGTWIAEAGAATMKISLKQESGRVSGTFTDPTGVGTISAGRISGSTLQAKWRNPYTRKNSGTLIWTLSRDQKSFSGSWKGEEDSSGTWTGRFVPDP